MELLKTKFKCRRIVKAFRSGTLFLLINLCMLPLYAQVKVNGFVKDVENQPLVGATVVIKGTTTGTVTDLNGNFSLEVPDLNAVLIISYVGYLTEEFQLNGLDKIEVTLVNDITGLDEIVVIGYGSQRKRDLTGSVATVDNERLIDIPATNLTAALQGSVAGLSINTSSGAPGSGSNILVRGVKSILASNNPLVIIDGIPGGSIDDIHPADIENIQVLKDAAATSIYGSRASGGVIIISTKRGKSGKVTVNYNGYYGFSFVGKKVDALSAEEYVAKKREIYRLENSSVNNPSFMSYDSSLTIPISEILAQNELEMYNLGKSYNWLDEITRNAPVQSHNLTLSGGDEKTQYFLSASMVDQTGIIHKSGFNRYSVRANISSKFTNWVKVGTNILLTRSAQEEVPGGIFTYSYQLSPLGKKYEDEENQEEYALYPMYPDEFIASPFTEIEIINKTQRTKLLNSTFIELNPLQGLTYRLTLNTLLEDRKHNYFVPLNTRQVQAFDKAENASIDYEDRINLNFENLITYNKTIGKHNLTGTFVFATEDYKRDYLWAYGRNFGSDYYGWSALEYGQVDFRDMNSDEEKTFLESYVGRFNYNYNGKYLLQLSLRNDRSSKFSKENRNAVFPGVSLGWVISDEAFMKSVSVINNLKLRLSWAKTGNQAIGYRDRFNTGTKVYYTTGQDALGQIVEGFTQISLANKDLKWEISSEINSGIDFQLFNHRLSGALELYKTLTTDLLWNQSISPITGFTSIRNNIGSLENKGIELSLNGIVIDHSDFSLKAYLTFSANKNKIIDLDGTKTDDVANRLFIGEPVGVIYDYVFDGIMQTGEEAPVSMPQLIAGEAKVKDIGSFKELEDGSSVRTNIPDSVINEADMTIIGQVHPQWYGSFGITVNYKNFDFSAFINHVHGTKRRIPVNISDRPHSMDIPYYTDENPNTQYGRPSWPKDLGRIGNQYGYLSYYVDGSYTRLQDVTLAYNFSNALLTRAGINKIRLYLTGQNLFTITDYKGYDPAYEYTNNQTGGRIDMLAGYPTLKNIICGINITF
ncbi:MAG: TonB-dependent receptor [Bacteroidales bacterium]|nr:TonB-dependent receptor [Bacteroidales bacterium]